MKDPLSWLLALHPREGFTVFSASKPCRLRSWRKTSAPLLLMAGVLSLAALMPTARADKSGDFYYFTSGADVTITSYTGPGGAVVIPSTINGLPVREISSAFSDRTDISSVTIPDSVSSIGSSAFYGCTGLTGVTIPQSVTTIGFRAFSGCTGLSGAAIPASVISIGASAFSGCSHLTQVTIPDSVTSIGKDAFTACAGLTSVIISASVSSIGDPPFRGCSALLNIEVAPANTFYKSLGGVLFDPGEAVLLRYPAGRTGSYTIPASVTSVGGYAFEGCAGLTSVTIPARVRSIKGHAFEGCAGLTGVTIPASVTSIGDFAFYNCTGLTGVTIPAGVSPIGVTPFLGCASLLNIEVASGNPGYKSIDGVLFDPGETTLRMFPGGRTGSYTIPASVTSIQNDAFTGCAGLTSVTIPGSVVAIGSNAFSHCTGLAGVTIPDSVSYIGAAAFSNCTSLTRITIPPGVTSIADSAFFSCTGLTGVILPNNVTSIGSAAFMGCGKLTDITLPAKVTSIGQWAFRDCTGLTGVSIPASVTSIQTAAFKGCKGLKAALFQGNAPTAFSDDTFSDTAPGFTISYYEGAEGFTSPTWKGYASVALPGLRVETLTLESGVAILRASGGRQGWIYTLRRGADLTPGSWLPVVSVGPLAADGALELKDTAPPASRAFYRVTGQSP